MGIAKSPAEVGKGYDESSPISDTLNDGQVHMSYWYDALDRTPLVEAARRLTRRVMGTLGLQPGDHVLDAGCGLGAPALLVAEETGARVTGITISQYELGRAQAKVAATALGHRVKFLHGDYTSLPFADDSFDAVIAVESLLCAPDKKLALSELRRVLREGGRITVADFTREAGMSLTEADEFAGAMGINTPPTLPEWVAELHGAGFSVDEYTQCGQRVFGVRQRYLDGVDESGDALSAQFGPEIVPVMHEALGAFMAPGPDRIGYGIVTGHNPRA
jgi:ubiquinone/menaquinone biosynthesis C-methylase UbiE